MHLVGTDQVEAPTRLATDCAAGKVVGCGGGRDDFLRLGISYDTRDFEPDPNSGVFVDAAIDAGTVALGSQFDYVRFMIAARGYWSPIADKADLVVAGRAVFEAQTKGAPFFSMDTFPFTEDPRAGLGGHRTMRGFKQDRFVGSVMTLANLELRWTFTRFVVWKQKLALIVAPFVDVGRPYDDLSQLQLTGWRGDYGGAFRIAWNLATIITVDYGRSSEDSGFFVNFNHIF
jgi:outer membrane protein assembly factor BamA